MSPVDGAGGRLVWIANRKQATACKRFRPWSTTGRAPPYRRHANSPQGTAKHGARNQKETWPNHGLGLVGIADMIVYEALKRPSRWVKGTGKFPSTAIDASTAKPKAQEHPVYPALRWVGEDPEGAWRELSRRLLDEPELRLLDARCGLVKTFFRPTRGSTDEPSSAQPHAKRRTHRRYACATRENALHGGDRKDHATANGRYGFLFRRSRTPGWLNLRWR